MHVSEYFKKLENNTLQCTLCPHNCILKENQYGICGVRKNKDGSLIDETYGRVVAVSMDPVEKKPLFHVKPGANILSFATRGCNFSCPWCQNHTISRVNPRKNQNFPHEEYVSPEELVAQALFSDTKLLAATYTEPVIFGEYALDAAKIAKDYGIINVWVTNGSFGEKLLENALPVLDAVNIDLKYIGTKKHKLGNFMCNPDLILKNIEKLHKNGVWIELTTLVVTGFNDDESIMDEMASFIASADKNIPWHISRYFPSYKYSEPPTPEKTILTAIEKGKKYGLNFVYAGNINIPGAENTYCPSCGKTLIRRRRYTIAENKISGGKCPYCNTEIPGIFD